MRVVFFIDHLRPDGTQRVLWQLVEGLSRRGHTLAVVCLNDSADPALVGRLRGSGAELRVLGRRALALGYGLAATLAWMRARRFDAAATLLLYSDLLGRPLARMAGVPRVISSIRARNSNYAGWQRAAVRLTMPLADAVVLNSAGVRDMAIAAEGARPERLVVIPNGVDVTAYARPADRRALRAELGLPGAGALVGSVGRLTHQKGFDLLLRALARLEDRTVALALFGEGEEERALRDLAGELGIAGRVRFAGYRRDLPRVLGALDLYAHPARFEGMPNALLEAMAAGCPIVATGVDGNRELIEDGAHGWLAPPADHAALAQAIGAALAGPEEARRRGDAARARAAERFSVGAMVDAWERVLGYGLRHGGTD